MFASSLSNFIKNFEDLYFIKIMLKTMLYIIVIMKRFNIQDDVTKIMFAPKLKPCKANMEPIPFILTKSHFSKFF